MACLLDCARGYHERTIANIPDEQLLNGAKEFRVTYPPVTIGELMGINNLTVVSKVPDSQLTIQTLAMIVLVSKQAFDSKKGRFVVFLKGNRKVTSSFKSYEKVIMGLFKFWVANKDNNQIRVMRIEAEDRNMYGQLLNDD